MAKDKTKTKSKSKFDFKDFLLKKGEYLAMGIAGVFLVLLTLWGITKWSSAKDPDKIGNEFTQKSQAVQTKINDTNVTDADKEAAALPAWAKIAYEFKTTRASDFPLVVPFFDPTAKPDTKKENPNVYPIGATQINLTRGTMRGLDIYPGKDGDEPMIGVIVDKKIDAQDKERVGDLLRGIKLRGKTPVKKKTAPTAPTSPKGPGGFFPPGGGAGGSGDGPPGGGMASGPGGKMGGSMGMGGFSPYGGMGGGFAVGGERVEKALEYIPISQLDEAAKKQKYPAMTVIPLRMITIHAEVPLKKQIDEIRRALRLPNSTEAARWGPYYDGYDVKRRISFLKPDGTPELLQDWKEYDFEDRYRELIHARRSANLFDEGYLAYFVRYEMSLALPLPELVRESSDKYPDIQLKNILDTIEKLKNASKKKVEPSELQKRLQGGSTRGDIYTPQGAEGTGAELWGPEAGMAGPKMGTSTLQTGSSRPPGFSGEMVDPNSQYNPNLANPVELEHLLLRFIDVAVEPGLTYEYQIRLRMKNPNFKRPGEVSKKIDAEKEFLDSPWVQLPNAITVPAETFLYATDWGTYSRRIKEEYEKEKELQRRLEVKDHQAVVETLSWMQEVKTSDGGKREPVGAWVVADYPVGRGEYVGRKTYVKLPLWSSENKQYILREIPDKVIAPKPLGPKDPPQPRGWLMDFTGNKSILVDFEGGKVRTKVAGREVTDECGTELLILRGDDKLVVKSSTTDESDKFRLPLVAGWEKWIKEVAARKASSGEEGGTFTPRPPGGN